MEFESAHSNTTAKLPILKLAQENGTSVTKMSVPVTAKEKTNKKNDALEDFWMNKAEIETISIDDLYNNFKIVEQNVKKSVGASSGAQNLAFMTASSTSSTNDVNTAKPAYKVSTVSSNVNTASPQVSTANFSDNTVYAFMVENPNGSNLLQQDLEQIHEDDLEAMDLKWECRAQMNKEGQFRYQDNTRKQGNNEDTSSKEMLAIDGVGFDWSDMAEEQVQTNMTLMAFSDSEVYNDISCTKTCLKNYETLKKQCDDLIVKLNQTKFTATTYKRGLSTVEEQLVTYRKNKVLFSEEVAVLKREVACKYYEINMLKSEFEKVKQEKEDLNYLHRILEENTLLILFILKTFECLRLHTLHAKPRENEFKSLSGQCLSEDIHQLILCPHEIQLNCSILYLLSNEMMSDVDVFRPGVLDIVAAEG
ncbi:hypothetical protein Tco_1459369 [Tanacetum coccineum]